MRNLSEVETARLVYFGCVHSPMSYGILLWGSAADIHRIFVLQKRTVRAIYKFGPRASLRNKFKTAGRERACAHCALRCETTIILFNLFRLKCLWPRRSWDDCVTFTASPRYLLLRGGYGRTCHPLQMRRACQHLKLIAEEASAKLITYNLLATLKTSAVLIGAAERCKHLPVVTQMLCTVWLQVMVAEFILATPKDVGVSGAGASASSDVCAPTRATRFSSTAAGRGEPRMDNENLQIFRA
ncbi:hypothetical protein EVAR_37070_1 [Eumeta japonica]|uniref:Uncharacterized protein n=1 Tax=Eumeta variegata TaxID=151549 RepID=A0A4C1WIR0_EUMVA|nr:hypothetical protein EVAR_37070_1 [Eumeta japonica]